MKKRILSHRRLRKIPDQFSWIDQKLVSNGHVERCSPSALALYLILVTVADSSGISYYGDTRLCQMMGIEAVPLNLARNNLIQNQLIAYEKPFYQVLDLPEFSISSHQVESKNDCQPSSNTPNPKGETLSSCYAINYSFPSKKRQHTSQTSPIGVIIEKIIERKLS